MPHRLHSRVVARAGDHCEYCLAPELISPNEFEVDHIWPRARGGDDALSNLALACRPCNQRKSSVTEAIDPETGVLARLFNPRRDSWDAHFDIELELGLIQGRTSIGRATVLHLGMNRPRAVEARLLWALAGWFPQA